jgi:hypothetical protein
MTMEELMESFRFQGRKDLLIGTKPELSDENTLDRATDANGEDSGSPLYRSISYLLVSLECLHGSKYLGLLEEA